MRRFMFFDRQCKGQAYCKSLLRHGYKPTRFHERADFVLTDSDTQGRRPHLETARAHGAKTFLYPHSARPVLTWDFPIYQPWEYTAAHFVVSECHADVMRSYGYSRPIHAVGWSYCEIKPFQPTIPNKVLFAPIHPVVSTGWLSETDKAINYAVFQKLLNLARKGQIVLTVRYLGKLYQNGLPMEDGVRYVKGTPELCIADIEAADVVVSHETFAYLAVARGKPTVMLAEWETPRTGASKETYILVEHWNDYKHLVMFPYSILAEDDTLALIDRAARSDCEIADWRARIIGEPFDGELFVQTLESYL